MTGPQDPIEDLQYGQRHLAYFVESCGMSLITRCENWRPQVSKKQTEHKDQNVVKKKVDSYIVYVPLCPGPSCRVFSSVPTQGCFRSGGTLSLLVVYIWVLC